MDKIKEQSVTSTTGPSTSLRTGAKPNDDIMTQIAALLQTAGYEGLGVVAIGPHTGQPHNPLDFMPTGNWQLQIMPIKARDD